MVAGFGLFLSPGAEDAMQRLFFSSLNFSQKNVHQEFYSRFCRLSVYMASCLMVLYMSHCCMCVFLSFTRMASCLIVLYMSFLSYASLLVFYLYCILKEAVQGGASHFHLGKIDCYPDPGNDNGKHGGKGKCKGKGNGNGKPNDEGNGNGKSNGNNDNPGPGISNGNMLLTTIANDNLIQLLAMAVSLAMLFT